MYYLRFTAKKTGYTFSNILVFSNKIRKEQVLFYINTTFENIEIDKFKYLGKTKQWIISPKKKDKRATMFEKFWTEGSEKQVSMYFSKDIYFDFSIIVDKEYTDEELITIFKDFFPNMKHIRFYEIRDCLFYISGFEQ